MSNHIKALIYLSFATLAFSSMELAGKLVVGHLTPLQVTFLRFALGCILLLPLACVEGSRRGIKLKVSDFGWLALLGVCNITIAMVLLQQAVTTIPASLAAIIISSNPIFVVIFASFILKEKVTIQTVLGLGIGILGLTLVTDVFNSVSIVDGTGVLSAVGAAIFFGLYTVLSKKVVKRLGGMITNAGSFTIGSLTLLIILLLKGEPVFDGLNQTTIGPVIYLGLVVTGFAYICFLRGLALIEAGKGSIIFFFKPVVASLLAFVVLHEVPGVNVLTGSAFVIVGSAIMILKRKAAVKVAGPTA